MLNLIIPVIIGYLIGSVPFGFIAGKLKGIDIRTIGSGNIGATNTFRALGKGPALTVLLLDLLKGSAAVWIAQAMVPAQPLILTKASFMIIAGLAAVIGHMFPVYLGFKGGKGSATSLGILLGITPGLFAITVVFALITVAVTRYVSVTSIAGTILVSALMLIAHEPIEYCLATLIVTVLVIYKHIPNIKRLMSGTEPKLWGKK